MLPLFAGLVLRLNPAIHKTWSKSEVNSFHPPQDSEVRLNGQSLFCLVRAIMVYLHRTHGHRIIDHLLSVTNLNTFNTASWSTPSTFIRFYCINMALTTPFTERMLGSMQQGMTFHPLQRLVGPAKTWWHLARRQWVCIECIFR